MKPKTFITTLLILFVAVSAGYLILNSYRTISKVVSNDTSTNSNTEQNPEETNAGNELQHKILVYYFYSTVRCYSCKKIEALSYEAIQKGFSDDLKEGRLIWKPVNIDKPENKHFIDDYNLHTKSVVIVDMKDGQQTKWKNLNKVWQLLKNKDSFIEYIQDEIKKHPENG